MERAVDGHFKWEFVRKNYIAVNYGLAGLGLVLMVVGLVLILRFKGDYPPEAVMSIICGLVLAVASLAVASLIGLVTGETPRHPDFIRLVILIAGGLLGLVVCLDVFVRAIWWWWSYLSGGLEAWQGKEGWRFWVLIGIYLAGLTIMLGSLVLARTEELSNPRMRRWLFGGNAVLVSLFVASILAALNLIGAVLLKQPADWTKSGIYTLSSKSQNVLKGLEQPVKVHVFLANRSDRFYDEVTNLLDNCSALTDRVQVEYIVRDRQLARANDLIRTYQLIDSLGLLVVYGKDHQFIKRDDLFERPDFMGRGSDPAFKGEDALITAITFLEEGKSRPVIYFTQGHGESDISDSLKAARPDQSASALRNRLQDANYEVKGLKLTALGAGKDENPPVTVSKDVPDDASVVVVAGPRFSLSGDALEALRRYMNPTDLNKKKGKLLVLLDAAPGDRMEQTGLETFLSEFNVEVPDERILTPNWQPHDIVKVLANPALRDRNPVAATFASRPLAMREVRPVKLKSGAPPRPGPSHYQPEVLLLTVGADYWAVRDQGDPARIVTDWVTNRRRELLAKLEPNLPVAVAVSETTAPADPHGFAQPRDQKPRLIIVGNATFASNLTMEQARQGGDPGYLYYSLFASSLSWLRERPASIGIEPKKRDTYQMNENTNPWRMVLLWGGVMIVGIIGGGLGVWVVRRR